MAPAPAARSRQRRSSRPPAHDLSYGRAGTFGASSASVGAWLGPHHRRRARRRDWCRGDRWDGRRRRRHRTERGGSGRGAAGRVLRDLARRGLDVALVDPGLHADRAERRLGDRAAELDVRAQRVQRDAAFALPLAAAHLGATQAAGDGDAHALRARLHRAEDGLLQHLAERHATLELLRDVLSYEHRVELGVADLEDVHLDGLAGRLPKDLTQLLDLRAALTDDDAGLRGVDRHSDLVRRTLDVDA